MNCYRAPFLGMLLGLLLGSPQIGLAADSPITGNWKIPVPIPTQRGEIPITFLLGFVEAEGKWECDYLGSQPQLDVEPKITDISVKDDILKFVFKLGPRNWSFEGKLAASGKKILGTFDRERGTTTIEMTRSNLKNLKDAFFALKEILDQADAGADFFDPLFPVLSRATEKKLKPEEVRAYTDKASKLAESYGPRWQRTIATRLADILGEQEAFSAIAVEQARQAERMLGRGDDAQTQIQTLDTLARALRRAKKVEEVKEVEGRIVKMEARDFAEYTKKFPPFKPEEFKGRKGKSDRAVLVELFTGAECPPCVGVDLAVDALGQTYKPTDVVILQYHLHIPGPDPLSNLDSIERAKLYGEKVRGTPSIFFNGKKDDTGGQPDPAKAKAKYQAYRESIEELLEKPATLKLTATASLKGAELSIKANVSDLEKPGEKVVLRIALAEERIRYSGGNGLRYHHCVVRALPGGVKGLPLTKKTGEQSVTVNLDELRTNLNKYLDDFAKKLAEEDETFPSSDRPLALKNLRIVAFVQDDETGEVLQSTQVELEEKKAE